MGIRDPTLSYTGRGRPLHLSKVLSEHKRWESMPNRREPLTKKMLLWIISLAHTHPAHSAIPALADWCILAIHFGFRLAEFIQTQENIAKHTIPMNIDNLPQAFIAADVNFFDNTKNRVYPDHSTTADHSIVGGFSLRWRYQKNQQNGEIKLMTRNNTTPQFCTVRAMLRIFHRARLRNIKHNQPLAIYHRADGKFQYLSHKQMESLIRRAALKVYNLHKKEDLSRFSCHSLRVGACVLLHLAGFSAESIQFELRWRSDSFKDYLRNILNIAAKKSRALQDFDPDTIEF